ncbi:MAG: DMT family transporter [Acetobacterales bacterium]
MTSSRPLSDRIAEATSGNLRGMLLALAAAFVFAVMHAGMRHATHELGLHALNAVFWRSVFGAAILLPLFLRSGLSHLRSARPGLHLCRISFNAFAQITFFWGVSLTPLAKVAALSFTAPLFATVIAVVFLGEVIRARRITALVIGFAGVLLIVQPGVVAIDQGLVMLLTSALLWSITLNLLKMLSASESPLTMTFYLSVAMIPITLVGALFVWQTPTPEQFFWLVWIGALGSFGQMLLAQAFKHSDATALMPLDFTKLIWAVILGLLIFAEIPDVWTLIGGTIIFASTTYITMREARLGAPSAPRTAGPPG